MIAQSSYRIELDASGTPKPPGGRINSHVRFGDDGEEVEAFGVVGVLSAIKGPAPSANHTHVHLRAQARMQRARTTLISSLR